MIYNMIYIEVGAPWGEQAGRRFAPDGSQPAMEVVMIMIVMIMVMIIVPGGCQPAVEVVIMIIMIMIMIIVQDGSPPAVKMIRAA